MSKRTLVTIGVCLGIFLSALDSSIVFTALPTVIAGLGGAELLSWVFAVYMLTSTTATPIFGKLTDLFGQKVLFVVGIGLFLIGSALSGGAQTMLQLIIFRAIQGIGAGGLMAIAFTIVGHIFTPVERPKIQSVLSSMWAISSIVGPTVGGFIVDHLSWRWVFYINIPIGIIPIALILVYLKDTRFGGAKPVIDFVGAATLSGSIVSLLLGLLQAQTNGWTSAYILGLFALAAALLLVFIWNESRVPEPLVPLSLFRLRTFTVCNFGNVLTGAALFGTEGFVPLLVQGSMGESATIAGISIMPLSIGWTVGSTTAGQVVNRIGYRNIGIIGMTVMSIGFYLLSGLGAGSTPLTVGLDIFFAGLGMGLLTPTVTAAVQNAVPRTQMGVASSSVGFYRTIGGTVGVSVMGTILNSQMASWTAKLVDSSSISSLPASLAANLGDPQLLLSPELSGQLPRTVLLALEQSLSNSFHAVFVAALALVLLGVLVAFFMPNSTPAKDMARMAQRQSLTSTTGD